MASARSIVGKRVCLFTGASGTLGTAFCRMFRTRYDIAAVFATRLPAVVSQLSRPIDPLNPAASTADSDAVFAIQADLLDEREIRRVVELTLARFGRIDLLVNAAAYSCWGSALETNEVVASAGRQFDLNVVVPLKLAVCVARDFWRDRSEENRFAGRNVVNVSSTAGAYVYADSTQLVYSATKAALNHLSCHLAEEFRPLGVRVNALAPNTFPAIVPTEAVARGIHQLDRQTTATGQILVMDNGGQVFFRPD